MAVIHTSESGRESARTIVAWDPLVRLIHWALAFCILLLSTVIDDEGPLHEWVGYVAVALVVLRLIWGLVGHPNARLSAFPPNPIAALNHIRAMLSGEESLYVSHNPLGALMVYNIWLTIFLLGATGYMMGTFRFFGVPWVEELHEAAYAWLLVSIALHVGGVMFDTWRSGVPLVRAMINGRKCMPENRSTE